ncbi:hypothetical protein AB7849_00295 [Rhodanobacter sp. 115]|uniref:hypothetical protein n=1 Tax=Rhodanobacter sp. FW021-MT20 TaxID=1162282 RepID=UPI0012F73682|nr:hypothetical protein [Rhodanobacter sp. 115]
METQSHNVPSRVAVRWPFRILAAIIVLAGLVAVVGATLAWWSHGAGLPKWRMLFALPGVAWLIRVAWTSAIRGRPPVSEYWPFASQNIFTVYVIVFLVASYA